MRPIIAIGVALTLNGVVGERTILRNEIIRVDDNEKLKPNYKIREIKIEADPEFECPIGFTKVANDCKQLVTKDPEVICPEGWQFSKSDQKCIGFRIAAPEMMCEDGEYDGQQCSAKEVVPMRLQCPDGYYVNPEINQCEREVYHEPMTFCPPGTVTRSGDCYLVNEANIHLRCPSNYSLINNRCVTIEEVDPTILCPQFFDLHGRTCKRVLEQSPQASCHVGTLSSGACVSATVLEPITFCPDGFLPFDEYNCKRRSSAAPKYYCNPGLSFNELTHQCEGDSIVNAIVQCTKGTIFDKSSGTCTGHHSVKSPNYGCPPSYHFLNKHQCVKRLTEPGQKKCPSDYKLLSKTECALEELSPVIRNCPAETIEEGGACFIKDLTPPTIVCAEDFVMRDGVCIKKISTPAILRCNENFVLSAEMTCIRKHIIEPTTLCPADWSKSTRGHTPVCERLVLVDREIKCLGNQRLIDTRCVDVETIEPKKVCPTNYSFNLTHENCYTVSLYDTFPICPKGFNLVGNNCIMQEEIALDEVCPIGYKLSGTGLCIKELLERLIPICPVGFKYDVRDKKCSTVKVEYDFDEPTSSSPQNPEEKLLDLEIPQIPGNPAQDTNGTTTVTTTSVSTEPEIEISVVRPIVEKGLVMREEELIIRGPASEVARQQQQIKDGVAPGDLQNANISYAPPVPQNQNWFRRLLSSFV